jgi:hypothetical protein
MAHESKNAPDKPMPKKSALESPAMDHIRSASTSTMRSNGKGGKK